MKKVILILLTLAAALSAQIPEIRQFEIADVSEKNPYSFLIENAENDLLMFYVNAAVLYVSKSTDYGTTWNPPDSIVSYGIAISQIEDINALLMNNGRILLTYKTNRHYARYSDDNGDTWSDEIELQTAIGILGPRKVNASSLTQTDDGSIWFVYSQFAGTSSLGYSTNIYSLKSNDGITWPADRDTLIAGEDNVKYGTLLSLDATNLILTYQMETDEKGVIYNKTSTDNGNSWSEPEQITSLDFDAARPRIVKDETGKLWLLFEKLTETIYEDYQHTDIYYTTSNDRGENWSNPTSFTNYVGKDWNHSISLINNKVGVSFGSNRTKLLDASGNLYPYSPVNYYLWYGLIEESIDSNAPPILIDHRLESFTYAQDEIRVNAHGFDDDIISAIIFNYSLDGAELVELILYDDGLHNDAAAGDNLFANDLKIEKLYNRIDYFFTLTDNDMNISKTNTYTDKPNYNITDDSYYFEINKIRMPINSHGIMAYAWIGSRLPYGRYDEANFLYSGGFMMSGYADGNLWGNGMASSFRSIDYLSGKIEKDSTVQNRIFILRNLDVPFGDKWQEWKDAVKLGARFHDGDYDGIYNPVDKNGNGKWDKGEDRPDLMGDLTAWCVYNDGVPSDERNFENVSPMGIEIRQTVFGYSPESFSELEGVIFIRYSIQNTGQFFETLDSVYFSHWSDPDMGFYDDDLVGCDVELNSCYIYNNGSDDRYGYNPPVFLVPLLQGPPTYIPGETFEDNNSNGRYDNGIDTPIETAYSLNGIYGDTISFPGAKNQDMTANGAYSSGYLGSSNQSTPDNELQLRNYQKGLNPEGELIDPCSWEYGHVYGMDCNSVNPVYMYSGDPVTEHGWINTLLSGDQRMMSHTGPFTLKESEPIDIIIAYVVGRGTDALNSITEARLIAENVQKFYKSNFTSFITDAELTENIEMPTKFSLSQNYPNPFNPTTIIKYRIPFVERDLSRSNGSELKSALQVKLKVYDILGREVAILVNKKQKPGSYEVEFNGNHLSSGIYFYKLKVGSFLQTRKMLLLR